MKDFWESLSTILHIVLFLGLVFLFQGKPSVWDRLHDAAMDTCKEHK